MSDDDVDRVIRDLEWLLEFHESCGFKSVTLNILDAWKEYLNDERTVDF